MNSGNIIYANVKVEVPTKSKSFSNIIEEVLHRKIKKILINHKSDGLIIEASNISDIVVKTDLSSLSDLD